MSNFIKLISLSLKLPLLGVVFFHFIPNYIKKRHNLKKYSTFTFQFSSLGLKKQQNNIFLILVREQTNHLAGK